MKLHCSSYLVLHMILNNHIFFKGTEFIEGMVLAKQNNYEACWGPKAFSMLCNLRVLIIAPGLHLQLPLGLKCLPNSIKFFEWWEYPLQ